MSGWWRWMGCVVVLGAVTGVVGGAEAASAGNTLRVVVVDALGVPQERVSVRVQARREVPQPHLPVQIELHPDQSLQPVVPEASPQPVTGWKTYMRSWTKADGHVDIDLSTWKLRQGKAYPPSIGRYAEPHHPELRVALDVPMKEPVELVFHLGQIPDERLTFVMPGTGAMDVTVLTTEGGKPRGFTEVEVHWEGQPERRSWAMANDGVARFPHVGVGGTLIVNAKGWGSRDAPPMKVAFLVPGSEPRPVTIRLGETYPILQGRIVDPKVTLEQSLEDQLILHYALPPQGERRQGMIEITVAGRQIREWVNFDATGRFQFAVEEDLPALGTATIRLWFQKRTYRLQVLAPPTHHATAKWELPARSGPIELGDLPLRPVSEKTVVTEDDRRP